MQGRAPDRRGSREACASERMARRIRVLECRSEPLYGSDRRAPLVRECARMWFRLTTTGFMLVLVSRHEQMPVVRQQAAR